MIQSIKDCAVLNNGVKMPWLGLGVFLIEGGKELENAIRTAVSAGYRSIDTAFAYNNEVSVGQGIRTCGVSREDLFITTKLWNRDQGYESTLKAFESSRKSLGLDYLDLYLIHWPTPLHGTYADTWKAMVKLYKEGLIRAIGVSNFTPGHIRTVIEAAGVVPAINQVECHPWFSQKDLLAYCQQNKIQMEAYSPLLNGRIQEIRNLDELAAKYGKSPAQITLRWHLQNKIVIIPKSVHSSRILENAAIFDFELTDQEMALIDGLNQNMRLFSDPDKNNYRGEPGPPPAE
jgi:diketogulonate reductase-like aldo/keto reductase